jgi:hypothetical protein
MLIHAKLMAVKIQTAAVAPRILQVALKVDF